ncbi:hypothetical protein M0804_005035 [Polistes exclamans]|nr:hypothetical protein M0804_005035 [Polistes exclamans]
MAVVGTRHNNLVTRDSLAWLPTPYVFLSITCTYPPRCPDGVDRTSRVESASREARNGEREREEGCVRAGKGESLSYTLIYWNTPIAPRITYSDWFMKYFRSGEYQGTTTNRIAAARLVKISFTPDD